VRYSQITDSNSSLFFEVEECQRKRNQLSCQSLTDSGDQTSGSLTFTPQPNRSYNFKIYGNTSDYLEWTA
jgi:hypothetical protein